MAFDNAPAYDEDGRVVIKSTCRKCGESKLLSVRDLSLKNGRANTPARAFRKSYRDPQVDALVLFGSDQEEICRFANPGNPDVPARMLSLPQSQ